ncbi:uncharacterized protein RHIMIDRAFT_287737 [Rhizopus microsporus ATCC 52813]|uniref:Zn(2)-C6 fungal-type domain-containing protein n=1 Tax=Rhizopus microsporus ATCC 52813 TaxID=1340429 RepID=A0A2G4ST33_RHIZD|nr:uncharacterized protein RHIMIDRAFT_287737 [Rhizopus microsporus ATCC 52813]PHZ11958.1 hypothetical protein RHIMIDRAFT_287737 [Rhizopus microsporus ATCC 52813]
MTGSLPTDPQQKPKKKKAARACVHCQKAHLTCDDSRPCQRCIKRDLASTCTDGVRKKAKYLQEDQILSFSSGFSSTTPLEYSMLTNMLGSPHQFLDSASCSSSSSSTIDRDPVLLYPASRKTHFPNVKKPYNYVEGYHYLINYVRERMGRQELMRISKALSLFRPSMIASMMNLTEADLIFTERCLQRTMMEYEKLVSYSGTPTVIWRRTGEIVLVGKEFSLLTQWSKEALMNKKTYIFELMSHTSAIEYWEKYALHAFENANSAVYSTCILLSPTKRLVPCTFCFTIKRDIFDLPSIIIGNFLPILS